MPGWAMSIQRLVAVGCVLTAMLGLAACNSTSVRHDQDARANIANYHTFAWQDPKDDATAGGAAFKNPINEKRLHDAVEANLIKQGLQPAAEGATPDAFVTIAVGTRQTIEVEDRWPGRVGFGWGYYGRRYGGFGTGFNWTTDGIYDYREGRISVDMYDAKTRQAIWHAAVEQDLSYLTGAKAEQRINEIVAAMFTKFPGAVSTAAK